MNPLNVLLVFGAVIVFCITLLFVLAFFAAALSAYYDYEEAYDDLHEEKEYLDNYKAKRQHR
jgi:hypothetical protein